MSTAPERRVSEGQYRAALRLTEPDMAEIVPRTSHVSAASYLDDGVFRLESERIFARLPVPALVSQDLPAPDAHRAVSIGGIAVLVTRQAGRVRAFLNACSHRGTRLVDEGEAGTRSRITCRYHAWTYDLDGSLAAVPREECFVGLERGDYGLKPLPCHEAGGIVWVSLDRLATLDDEAVGRALVRDLEAIGLGEMRAYRSLDFDLHANWKLVTDAFLEGYHVRRLHTKTLARFFVDAPQMIETIGRHLRQTSGSRRGFSAEHVADPSWAKLRQSIVYAYIAFPSAVVVTSPAYVSVLLLTPVATHRTRARYVMLVDRDAAPETEDLHARSFALMAEAFGNEDFRAAELQDEGLRTGALERVTLGGMEQGVRSFHDVVEACLAAG